MSTRAGGGGGDEAASTNPELESFREQWRAEVRARNPPAASASGSSSSQQQVQQHHHRQQQQHHHVHAHTHNAERPARRQPPPPTKKAEVQEYEDDYVQPRSFDEPETAAPPAATVTVTADNTSVDQDDGELVSALDHYEKAVERESVGKLGDSLRLYRKAFRMDDRVDQKYKNKHFPKPVPKPGQDVASALPSTPAKSLSMKELIASFSNMSIEPAPPEMEGTPQPPCPMAELPDEILVHILRDVAVLDVGDFMCLAQVCKRLAYLVATEDGIWRRICLGTEYGFAGMHYHWQLGVSWEPLTAEDLIREAGEKEDDNSDYYDSLPLTLEQRADKHAEESATNTLTLYRTLYSSSWQRMFRVRPRIRFNGCYIATVNYIRPGQAATSQYTWANPVHIVTYYRYLRFFRDGSVLSLLTTAEPADVVHHLTREKAALHAGGAQPHLPSIAMQSALKGRWRLEGLGDNPEATISEVEGNLVVETEGVSSYIYRLDLSLRSAGSRNGPGARNNKLVWRGFYSFNRLTGDWAEFTLKHGKPFFFSRVKSYGVMGQ
ncbi:hypothetical protein B0H66DRAFT_45964 [Apodospora peruviana]|uniref:F-box domain-containing protein n=1 Tax=Apodospora peruviana TaxID=516989 RepID=A0AAE0IS95_9PEZI|nr:hypothetical protein B0H66DRAFT_45964 [Apodospora peruviana]